jgi:hypothetical protein
MFDRVLHGFEDVAKAAVQYLVQDLFLGFEMVVDAAGLDLRARRDLSQRRRGKPLPAKQLSR